MANRPKLKSVTVQSADGQLVIWQRALKRVFIDDAGGSLAALLQLLTTGEHPFAALPAAMASVGFEVTEAEIGAVVSTLDEMGLIEDADGDAALDAETRERHESNLRFYDLFSRLDRDSASLHRSAQNARVLLLGAGGVGSGVLQSLVGLGVGEVVIVDTDVVETKNLARQFVYGMQSVGRPKVEAAYDWAMSYSTGTRVTPVHRRITDVASIVELGARADVLVCAIDSPDDIHLIVNEACFELGIPYVAGGLNYSTLSYWSVEPGRTPCRLCLDGQRNTEAASQPAILRGEPLIGRVPVNRATGPIVQLVSGFMSMEVMRYLTRTDPPVAGATYHVIELADGMTSSTAPWPYDPACGLCT
ncbi:MAG TPA: ThiF family adenylyltransferase, partial [Micromonosporaceae bacterium]